MKLNYSGDELLPVRTSRRHQSTWTHLCSDSVDIELLLCHVSGESVDDCGGEL